MDHFFGLDKARRAPDENAALLTTVHDDIELGLICGILEEEGIPCLCLDRGSGEVARILSGFSMVGCDIFVPRELLDKATELLDAYRNGEPVLFAEDEIVTDPDEES